MTKEELIRWNARSKAIDDHIHETLKQRGWQIFLPYDHDTDGINNFYEHIMFVILQFLETEERELFIKIPVQELCNIDESTNDSLQNYRWQALISTLEVCLALATKDTTKNLLLAPNSQYNDRDYFLCYDRKGKLFYCEYYADRQKFLDVHGGDVTVRFHAAIVKYRCKHPLAAQRGVIPYEPIREAENCLNRLKISTKQYKTAALVSYSNLKPRKDTIPWKNQYIVFPVSFASNENDVTGRDSHNEIIIISGDDKYQNSVQSYRNTDAKKIIYIGSVFPDDEIKTYPFTLREMYGYCCPEDAPFIEPTIDIIDFPWLDDVNQKLNSLIKALATSDSSLTTEICNRISKKIISRFLSSEFSQQTLERFKTQCDEEWVSNLLSYDVDPQTVNSIVQWVQNLEYTDINPKLVWMKAMQGNLTIDKWGAYRNDIRALRGYRNIILIDNLSCNKYDTRFSFITRYHLGAIMKSVYYRGYEEMSIALLKNALVQDAAECCSEIRKEWGTSYDIKYMEIAHVDEAKETLDDYEELDRDNYEWHESSNESRTVQCVTFCDGTTENLDGEVLIVIDNGFERCSIRELLKYILSEGDTEILYYKKPARFEEYIQRYLGLPLDADIQTFSILWKNCYKSLFEQYEKKYDSRATNILHAESHINKSILEKYAKDIDNTPKFLRTDQDMKSMCNLLHNHNLMSEQECKYVQRARKLNNRNSSYGLRLKDELYGKLMDEARHYVLLEKLQQRCRMDIHQLTDECIQRNTVKSVQINIR